MPLEIEETEVKFYAGNLAAVSAQVLAAGIRLRSPRSHELNFRYDTPHGDLMRARRVLRLRRDQTVHLTYKEGGRIENGVFRRKEIEFEVMDFDAAHHFLLALGYEKVFTYEKFRTTYEVDATEIVLDELPFGDFVEIEGALAALRPIAARLGLNWDVAVGYSYHDLFERLRAKLRLPFRDLTFSNFANLRVTPDDLGVKPADT